MGHAESLFKRLSVLEAKCNASCDRSPPQCDLERRLKRYEAYFGAQPWECTASPERKAERNARLATYKKFFDGLEELNQ